MPTFQYYITDVFTSARFGGNQLAVFPDAREIPEELMPRITREFNFSETTFVLPPSDPKHARRVRIFTPGAELPFAGHPTIGTAFVLAAIGQIPVEGVETRIVFEEKVGPVPVTIRANDGKTGFAQLSVAKLPERRPTPGSAPDIARALGLDASDVLDGEFSAEGVSCGMPFLFIPVRDRRVLGRVRIHVEEYAALLRGYWAQEVFVFCDDPELPGSHYRARMFAPTLGIPEDPATGGAAAAFGGYLARRDKRTDGTLRWVVEQGFEMGRPSIIEVEADKKAGEITAVRVGGNSVLVSKGEFYA